MRFAGILLCGAAFGQPAFEVASIKPADPSPMGRMEIRMSMDAGMLRYTNVSLKDCIRVAYRVKDFQIEGPDGISDTRFNITAKLPEGASTDQVPEMLQKLLADRFQLTLHRETKDHAIYALVAEKSGARLKPAEVPVGDAGAQPGRGGRGERGMMMMSMQDDGMHVKASSTTLANLGEMLSRFTDRPVIDMTGIQGQYDFDLSFTPETMRGMPAMPPHGAGSSDGASDHGGTVFDAVQRYGLKLESRKAPMEILIVDHVEKTPTEN